MSNQPFRKFIAGPESGAKKKERIRQEKKKVRQETKEYFEKKKEEARQFRAQGPGYKPRHAAGTAGKQDSRDEEQGTKYKAQGGKEQGSRQKPPAYPNSRNTA